MIASGLVIALGGAGCQPPPPVAQDVGQPIIKIKAQTDHPPQYRNWTHAGVDWLQSPYPAGKFGGALYASSIGAGPKTLNPLVANDATSSSMGALMFEGLITRNAHTGAYEPRLAESFTVAPDNMTYTITLRRGLKWSDGHPLTADDVVFTWNSIIKQGLGNRSNLDVILVDGQAPTVTKLDERTIQFKTAAPFAPFLGNLGSAILPKHIVAPVIAKEPAAFDPFWGVNTPPDQFVVSGPFKLAQYDSGSRIVFTKNPHYFMVNKAGQRLPYVDRYVIEFVRDLNAEKLLFEQGRVDSLSVPGQDVFYVKQLTRPSFKMFDMGPTTGTTFVTFNLNPRQDGKTHKPYVDPVHSRWFRNIKFRQAVDYAIRRDQMVQNILRGVGKPLYTAEALSSIYLNKALADGHPADLDKARKLLKEAGFSWNSEKRLIDAQGHEVEFELLTNAGNTEREAVGVSLKEDLEQLGMKVNFKPIEFNVLVGKVSETLEWDAVVLGLTGSGVEPHGGVNVWRHDGTLHLFNLRKPERDAPGQGQPEPWEQEIDTLFNQGSKVIAFEDRKPFYDRYQAVVYEQLPLIYLYSPNRIVAVNQRIQNLDPTPLNDMFHNLESLWVKP